MAQTLGDSGTDGPAVGAISPEIPARAIAHLCTCDDPMQYSGRIVDAPALVATLTPAG
jgi:hypothetical protein